tara:strand:- start:1334 stop:1903 length:570 start_codon:yes stop_codon:yes gene_type:complete
MATFPSIEPSYGLTKTSQPKTRIVQFADGYEHRILFGLASHQNPEIYNLAFNNITESDADVIEGFLRSRANDNASFTYSPPSEGFTKTGTYSQSGTTVTITITDHGVAVNDLLTIDYTSGSAVDGSFVVASVTTTSVFTVVAAASATNSGNVSITLAGAKKFVCNTWNKRINYPNRATITATFRQVFEP